MAMKDHGWEITSIDNCSSFNPTIVADLTTYKPVGQFDLIWASPPCTDFARWAMPLSFGPRRIPDMRLLLSTLEIIDSLKPRFWIIENVRGARAWFKPYLSLPTHVIGPYNFWTNILNLQKLRRAEFSEGKGKWKLSPSPLRPALRSKIPYAISKVVAMKVEEVIYTEKVIESG